MTTITADDIRVLAQASGAGAVLARDGDGVRVAPDGDVPPDEVVYTKAQLRQEYGDEVTDVEAEVLAAGLTAELGGDGGRERPETDVTTESGTVEPPD